MAGSKRAVVLRLAELEKYPTLRARYEITLPFNNVKNPSEKILVCNCPTTAYSSKFGCQGCERSIPFAKLKAKAVKQTEKRWIWFSDARKLDDELGRRLGTLGYLPFEIREMIWSAVIDNYKVARQQVYTGGWYWHWPETEKTWLEMPLDFKSQGDMDLKNQGGGERSSEHPDMFDLASYHKWNDYRWSAMYVRFVSPQAKIELENVFVSRNIFSFSCPLLLTYFLNQLLAGHRPLLRSITLRLFGCLECYYCGEECIKSDCRAWVAVIERLPATLQIVTIELGQHGINFFNCGACTIPGSQTSKDIKKAVGLLEIVTKRVRRYAPKAKISMAGLDRLCDTGRETMQSMFDEVEPFSEDFLKWSDQSRKNATD